MTRKYSEGEVRKALTTMDLDMIVFHPQDFAGPSQNVKPADFLVWTPRGQMIEVKETDAMGVFRIADFRPNQLATMRRCKELGIPYFAVIRWSKLRRWTITTGDRILFRLDSGRYLRSDMPIDCPPGDLVPHLRMALLGEID